jgi:hypothetical protein
MAVLGLVIADNRQRYTTADQLAALVESLNPATSKEQIEQSRARAVYHSSFGDLTVAANAATVVVDSERLSGKPTAALSRALRWLSIPLKLADNVPHALAALKEAFDVAANLKLPHEMFEAAACLLDLAVDCEDPALAHEWLQITTELRNEIPIGAYRWASCAYLHARAHAMSGEYATAREQLEHSGMPAGAPFWTRAQQSVLSLEMLLAMHLDAPQPRRDSVRRLRRLHLRTRRYGASDFEFGVLAGALAAWGDYEDAAALIAEYELLRRTRLPRHSVLQRAIEEVTRAVDTKTL